MTEVYEIKKTLEWVVQPVLAIKLGSYSEAPVFTGKMIEGLGLRTYMR